LSKELLIIPEFSFPKETEFQGSNFNLVGKGQIYYSNPSFGKAGDLVPIGSKNSLGEFIFGFSGTGKGLWFIGTKGAPTWQLNPWDYYSFRSGGPTFTFDQ